MSDHEASSEQVEEATRARRVRVRGAHRGAVTRLVSQSDEARGSTDVGRLKQLKQSLRSKMEILSVLDEQILELVEDDQVESEVEQADLVREKSELAIISIEETLSKLIKKPKSKTRSPYVRESDLSSSSGEERTPTTSRPSQATNVDEPESSHCVTFGSLTPSGARLSATAASFSPSYRMRPFTSVSTLGEALPTVTSSAVS